MAKVELLVVGQLALAVALSAAPVVAAQSQGQALSADVAAAAVAEPCEHPTARFAVEAAAVERDWRARCPAEAARFDDAATRYGLRVADDRAHQEGARRPSAEEINRRDEIRDIAREQAERVAAGR